MADTKTLCKPEWAQEVFGHLATLKNVRISLHLHTTSAKAFLRTYFTFQTSF